MYILAIDEHLPVLSAKFVLYFLDSDRNSDTTTGRGDPDILYTTTVRRPKLARACDTVSERTVGPMLECTFTFGEDSMLSSAEAVMSFGPIGAKSVVAY